MVEATTKPSMSVLEKSLWLVARIVVGGFLLIAVALMFRLLVPALFGIIIGTLLMPVHAVQTIYMIWTTQPADMTGVFPVFLFRIALTFVAGWYLILGLVGVLFLAVAIASSHR
jgi:hypothetical protein